MEVIHFFILLFFIGAVVLFILSLVNQAVYKVPHVSTFNSDLVIIREALGNYSLQGKRVADLGSGTGKMLRLIDKEFQATVMGYEIDVSNVLISKTFNAIGGSHAKVIKGNYLKVDLQKYDFLYIYLFPCLMKKVEERIFSHCEKGTIVFVNAFKFEKHTPIEIFYKNGKEKIFVYKV